MLFGTKEISRIGTVEWRYTLCLIPRQCVVDNRIVWLEYVWQYRTFWNTGWSWWYTVSPDDMSTLIREGAIKPNPHGIGWILPDGWTSVRYLIERVCYGYQ